MIFEIVEYQKDENGNPKEVCTYTVEQFDLSRTIDALEKDVRDGRIADFDIAKVG